MLKSPVPEGNLSHPKGWLFYWWCRLAATKQTAPAGTALVKQ